MQLLLGLCTLVSGLWPLMSGTHEAALRDNGLGTSLEAVLHCCESCGQGRSCAVDLNDHSMACEYVQSDQHGEACAQTGTVQAALHAQLALILRRLGEQAPD